MAFVPGLTVRILTREGARTGHKSVMDALVELVRRDGLSGITVTCALEGYSAHGGMRTSNWQTSRTTCRLSSRSSIGRSASKRCCRSSQLSSVTGH